MVELFAVSLLATRTVKQKGQQVNETSHAATWLMIDDQQDNLEQEAMSVAASVFPAKKGWEGHGYNAEIVPYSDICDLIQFVECQTRTRRNVVTGSVRQPQPRQLRQAHLPPSEDPHDYEYGEPEPQSQRYGTDKQRRQREYGASTDEAPLQRNRRPDYDDYGTDYADQPQPRRQRLR